MVLSDRMRAVAGLVEPCGCIADIGCDHGYVAIELIRSGICRRVIAMDINAGPLERAKANIEKCRLQEYIQTRQSDGMDALSDKEADGIICAGMGGKLIISILQRGSGLLENMGQLILQPQSEIGEVRAYLRENGFSIARENMVCEDGKYYPMMRAVHGKPDKHSKPDDAHILVYDTYGRYLLENADPTLKKYLLKQKSKLEEIRGGLKDHTVRALELEQELRDIAFCLGNYY